MLTALQLNPPPRQVRSLLTALVLWAVLIAARNHVIQPYCAVQPSRCQVSQLSVPDQFSALSNDLRADHYSDWTQKSAAALLLLALPLLTLVRREKNKRRALRKDLRSRTRSLKHDLLLALQVFLWNGALTEFAHFVSQRPRPFVYREPLILGLDPAHYTSFYSGHTSFTAALTLTLFLLTLRHRLALPWQLLALASYQGLTLATAYFRILAGRHFLSDVICGAIAGSWVAWIFFYWQSSPFPRATRTTHSGRHSA